MNGFEVFDAQAWVVDGLFTRHIDVSAKKAVRQPHAKFRTRLMLPIAGSVMALYLAPVQQAAAQTYARAESSSVLQASSHDPDLITSDPKTYWSRLMHDIRQRPRAPESTVPDPDPLF